MPRLSAAAAAAAAATAMSVAVASSSTPATAAAVAAGPAPAPAPAAAPGNVHRGHLDETPPPSAVDAASAAQLARLAARCAGCGTLLVPAGAVRRLTQRLTPLGPTRSALVSSVFSNGVENVVCSSDASPCPARDAQAVRSEPLFQRGLSCAGCGRRVGYQLEDVRGAVYRGPRTEPFKLWYFCGAPTEIPRGRAPHEYWPGSLAPGQLLELAQRAPYDELVRVMAAAASGYTAAAAARTAMGPPSAVERTARLLPAGARGDTWQLSALTHAQLVRARAACDAGSCLLRSLPRAWGEEDGALGPHVAGLAPRNAHSRASRREHVGGERDSPFTSASESAAVVLAWALPFGRAAIIVPGWAVQQGASITGHAALLAELAPSGTDGAHGQPPPREAELAARSREALIHGHVDAAAVESVHASLSRLSAGPILSLAPPQLVPLADTRASPQGGASGAAPFASPAPEAAVRLPISIEALRALRPVQFPGAPRVWSTSAEHDGGGSAAPLRSPDDFFARRSVVALAPAGTAAPTFVAVGMTVNAILEEPSPPMAGAASKGGVQWEAAATGDVASQLLGLRGILAAGARQLAAAQHHVCVQHGDCTVALYEVDVELHQERVVCPALHQRVVARVPLLLLPWSPRATETALRLCQHKGRGVPRRGAGADMGAQREPEGPHAPHGESEDSSEALSEPHVIATSW